MMKHAGLLAIFPILSLGLLSCMKPPEVNRNFGRENSASEVSEALGSAEYESTITSVQNIRIGQFSYTEKSNQVENLFPLVFRQKADTVTGRAEDSNKINFTIDRELRELDNLGNMKPSKSQYTACLPKVSGGCDPAAEESLPAIEPLGKPSDPSFGVHAGKLGDLAWRSIMAKGQASGSRITYHNLSKTYTQVAVPSLVSIRPDCGGRPGPNPCEAPMQAIQINFDQVDWSTEEVPVKTSYVIIFSPEAPFMAAQLLSCGSTTIPWGSQRIALMQCDTVKDFTYGRP